MAFLNKLALVIEKKLFKGKRMLGAHEIKVSERRNYLKDSSPLKLLHSVLLITKSTAFNTQKMVKIAHKI